MSVARDLADYLEAQGVGVFGGDTDWSLHIFRQPADPDRVVTLYDTGGADPLLIDGELRQPSLQVRARGQSPGEVDTRLALIWRTLAAIVETEINDHYYVGVYPTGDVLDLGYDDNDRAVKTANYAIIRSPIEEAS